MHTIEPVIEEHGERPYASIRDSVRMDAFDTIAHRFGELVTWVTTQGSALAGAPFFRFHTVDLTGESDVEAGVPVTTLPPPEGDIRTGTLPGGRYATLRFTGHPDQLFDVADELRTWAARQGLAWDLTETPDGVEHWGCRLESYLTDPRVEPDPNKWETELSFRLAD
ncbi:GyrI-like domain-containing protein [Streptomyces yaizuensis]|uniref:GyrI-like domain-containing protein n=1 Tax=Streptomyces yaizuensis TaxID=2989713 RepID=A0ABQ5P4W6_9ACTN|nr:GyrI-like domain-containing protein [Streptomyces sp. YSPA8]GLF97520.1 GyrI-like domain-containing protein [Streptomyces sp. YSPA8]